MAPWARKRARWVGLALLGGAVVVGGAILAMLAGTASAPLGVALALVTVALGTAAAWWLRRTVDTLRLELGPDGVKYASGRTRIVAAWDDVAAVDLVLRGTDTGPAIVLKEDRAVATRGRLAMGDPTPAVTGTGVAQPSMRSTIPLAAFVEGRFVGSAVEKELRRFVPALVDGFVLRHPERVR
jgi:hypothetical protein